MTGPAWLDVAMKYRGLAEVQGPHHNPQILKWWKDIGTAYKDDETPWCGAFVGGVLAEVGIKPVASAASARAWLRLPVELNKPAVGAVVIFWRGSKKGTAGHVAFVAGRDQHDNLMCIGGNQGNQVSIAPFDTDRVLGYRWPGIWPFEHRFKLPIISSTGKLSTNEA